MAHKQQLVGYIYHQKVGDCANVFLEHSYGDHYVEVACDLQFMMMKLKFWLKL